MLKKSSFFSKKLISWYLQNKRDLPWRGTSRPYFIWLSEILLQQTRVAQGLPYYLKFVKRFPTIDDLAAASEDEVLKLWQGLGYYSRARNLHSTAKYISEELNGDFPKTHAELLKLKGVGDYTASAIASLSFNEPTAVVDGNVYRVLSRVFGIVTPINESKGIKEFKALAQELIDPDQPGTYNQAIMEFGARYCVPQNPDCKNCIFNTECEANRLHQVSTLPVKPKKQKIRKRYFNYMILLSEDDMTILQQRKGKGIWQNLYEFPLLESTSEISSHELKHWEPFLNFSKKYLPSSVSLYNESSVIHKLSHQHLYTRFWIVEVTKLQELGIPISEITNYAVPVLIENFISTFYRMKS
jgi:A/G-specific adenine glycosylase